MMRRADPAMRAYVRRVVPTMVLYVVLICAVPFVIWALAPSGPLLWLLAVIPALPLCAVFWFVGRLLTDLRDEYLRMLEVRKALVATGAVMMLATAWGFLEVYAHAPHIPLYFVPIMWFPALGLGAVFNAIAERRGS